jgi:hypothetical protein
VVLHDVSPILSSQSLFVQGKAAGKSKRGTLKMQVGEIAQACGDDLNRRMRNITWAPQVADTVIEELFLPQDAGGRVWPKPQLVEPIPQPVVRP